MSQWVNICSIDDILPAAHAEGLVDAVDAYCEPIAFSTEEVSRLFDRARELGLPVKLHADQLSDGGGAALAARHRALSADHIEHATEQDVAAMAAARLNRAFISTSPVGRRSPRRSICCPSSRNTGPMSLILQCYI